MRDYKLSTEKIAELETLHRSLRDKRQADRIKAVIASFKGWSAVQIAEIVSLTRKHLETILNAISKMVSLHCWMITIAA